MDAPANTESARRQLFAGIAAVLVVLGALFAASPAMAEEAVSEAVSAAGESEADDLAATSSTEDAEPAAPAVDPAVAPATEETTPVAELLTSLPATEAEEAAPEPDPVPVAVTPEVIVNEPASPSPAVPTPVATTTDAPPNAAPDALSVAIAPSTPDPIVTKPRPYARPIVPPAVVDAPEPPPDAVPAAAAASQRLKLSESGLGQTIDELAKEWTKPVARPAIQDGVTTSRVSSTPFVEQITEVSAYVAPSAAGGFLQLLVAWVAPGDLGGAAVLAPLTQLLFVLVAWMLIRPRPLRETLSRFSADPRMGYRAVVLRPG